jgi:hypothetical protein
MAFTYLKVHLIYRSISSHPVFTSESSRMSVVKEFLFSLARNFLRSILLRGVLLQLEWNIYPHSSLVRFPPARLSVGKSSLYPS